MGGGGRSRCQSQAQVPDSFWETLLGVDGNQDVLMLRRGKEYRPFGWTTNLHLELPRKLSSSACNKLDDAEEVAALVRAGAGIRRGFPKAPWLVSSCMGTRKHSLFVSRPMEVDITH